MKLKQIYCPSCGGAIKGDLSKDSVFCPFCGQQLAIDHERKEVTITHNINVNKNETQRYINDADVIRANKYDDPKKWEFKGKIIEAIFNGPLVFIVYALALVLLFWLIKVLGLE